MKRIELKRKLVKMGIPVKAGMVKKSDIKKVLAAKDDSFVEHRTINLREALKEMGIDPELCDFPNVELAGGNTIVFLPMKKGVRL